MEASARRVPLALRSTRAAACGPEQEGRGAGRTCLELSGDLRKDDTESRSSVDGDADVQNESKATNQCRCLRAGSG